MMTSKIQKPESDRVVEGQVACSPNQWADMVMTSQSIPLKDPQKNAKLWDFGIKEHAFSSGSDLTKDDYLRLRVLWYTWTDIKTLGNYMRDNPVLINDNQVQTRYTGYISPENDEIANTIFNAIQPQLHGYLHDIQRVGKGGDATRPSADCGMFYMARYWQGLVTMILNEKYDENDRKRQFRGKVRKSEAGLPRPQPAPAGPSRPPQTPTRQKQPRQPHEGFGTPALDPAKASAGGLQNPATADETYVNTALLLLLQTVTRLMTDLEQTYRRPSNPSSRSTSTASSRAPSRTASQERTKESGSQANSRSGSVDRVLATQLDRRPSSQPSDRPSSSSASTRDNKEGASQDPLEDALSKLGGLRYLDWLADRVPLSLMDRSSKATAAKKLMEARVDGYLCRRDFVQAPGTGKQGAFDPRFNKFPLAILEAKPFTRLSAISAIRWQESAEIASWVSGLDDAYEQVGLLQSSTSGRKRSVCPYLIMRLTPSTLSLAKSVHRVYHSY
jgi:hypothetical protein